MSEFGNWRDQERYHRHRHHHHQFLPLPPWQMDGGDFGPPPIAPDMDDFGCDSSTPGFRVFGQDDTDTTDDGTYPQDDAAGGSGGVLDAVSQVAQGVADVIAPSAPPVGYPPYSPYSTLPSMYPVDYYHPRHHRHHHPQPFYVDPRFDPRDRRYDVRAWRRLSHLERERFSRILADRDRRFHGEELLLHQASKGSFGNPEQLAYMFRGAQPTSQAPSYRYGPQGYRPRGGDQYPHHHHHHHHHHQGGQQGYGQQGMGPQGYGQQGYGQQGYGQQGPQPLPGGSYQQTCNTCNYDGQTLACTCQQTDGNWQHSSVQTDPTGNGMGISNHNGQLVLAAT